MEFLFSGQLVGILVSALGVLFIAYMRKGRKDTGKQDSMPEAYLVDVKRATDKREYKIKDRVTTIGRTKGKDVNLCIAKNTISSSHAQIECKNGNFYLTDLRSRNGTYLNNEKGKVTGEVYIRNGDIITFDEYIFKFVVVDRERQAAGHTDRESYNYTIMRNPTD